MNTVERLRRWADARERRNPFGHGKTGTALLREAADIIEADTLTVEELRWLENLVGDVAEWSSDDFAPRLARKLSRMILAAERWTVEV